MCEWVREGAHRASLPSSLSLPRAQAMWAAVRCGQVPPAQSVLVTLAVFTAPCDCVPCFSPTPPHAPPSVEALTPSVVGFATNSKVRGRGPHDGISDPREGGEDTGGRPLSVNQDERPPEDPTSRTVGSPQSAVFAHGSRSQDHDLRMVFKVSAPLPHEPHLRLLSFPAGPSTFPWMHQVLSWQRFRRLLPLPGCSPSICHPAPSGLSLPLRHLRMAY